MGEVIVQERWDADHHQPRSVSATDDDTLEEALALARALADRLARLRIPERDADALRLARAMALNVVDLLEGSLG